MDTAQWVAFATVLAWWMVAALAVWRFGPGMHLRSVRCPVKKTRAMVAAEEHEVGFASLRVLDVTACSLYPGQRLACGKECLAHL
jgi:hypothetical protein